MSTESIVLGGGCFWCVEAVYKRITGVLSAQSGYAGGTVADPGYEEVCSGTTGHAEVVRVEFDPQAVTIDEILRLFFEAHDPTTLNRQGNDVGTQYRSIILYADDRQRAAAERTRGEVDGGSGKVVTEIEPLREFYPAEAYHRDYYDTHTNAGYCRLVIAPKLRKLGMA